MKMNLTAMQRDFYSDVLDSVKADKVEPIVYQANLAKIVSRAYFPVLSMPQVFDSKRMFELTEDIYFLSLVKKGMISTSFFGSFQCVADYALRCIGNPDYVFSSLELINGNSKRTAAIRRKLQAIISSEENVGFLRSIIGISPADRIELEEFVRNIKNFDSALREYEGGHRLNLQHPEPLSYILRKNMETLLRKFKENQTFTLFNDLISLTMDSSDKKEDRSLYYIAIDEAFANGDIERETYEDFKLVIDISYNMSMATRLAPKSRVEAPKSSKYAKELIELIGSNELRDTEYNARLIEEIQKTSHVGQKNCISWRALDEVAIEIIYELGKFNKNNLMEKAEWDKYLEETLYEKFVTYPYIMDKGEFIFQNQNKTHQIIEPDTGGQNLVLQKGGKRK
jgi:hypothetical protein